MTADAFWVFSVAFYARPGVSDACLRLQDEHGADVNLVLFALWCATRGCRLDPGTVQRAGAAVAPWREAVVRRLREARRALRPPPASFDTADTETLRKRLLSVELDAERLQQHALAAFAPAPGALAPGPAARANLRCLAHYAGIPLDMAPWHTLLSALA